MLTDLQGRKLARYFAVHDVDDDGRIAPTDFLRIVENVRILHGLRKDSREHRELLNGYLARWEALRLSADADDDGSVDLDEWLAYWGEVVDDDERYQEEVIELTGRMFALFDTDEDGVIGPDEFCDFYGVHGMSAALARSVFIDLDRDGDGRMSHDELLAVADEFYRGDDPHAPGNRLFGPY